MDKDKKKARTRSGMDKVRKQIDRKITTQHAELRKGQKMCLAWPIISTYVQK